MVPPVVLDAVMVYAFWVKLAVTVLSESIVMVTGLDEPVAPSDQPVKEYPALGVAVRLTCSPEAYEALSGLLATVPFEEFTVRVYVFWVKLAVTVLSESIVMVTGLDEPVAPPDQLEKE